MDLSEIDLPTLPADLFWGEWRWRVEPFSRVAAALMDDDALWLCLERKTTRRRFPFGNPTAVWVKAGRTFLNDQNADDCQRAAVRLLNKVSKERRAAQNTNANLGGRAAVNVVTAVKVHSGVNVTVENLKPTEVRDGDCLLPNDIVMQEEKVYVIVGLEEGDSYATTYVAVNATTRVEESLSFGSDEPVQVFTDSTPLVPVG